MKWHVSDIPFLLTQLPRALHDLAEREDTQLVRETLPALAPKHNADGLRHRIVSDVPPLVSIEKTLDPALQRSVQNIGLLLHDYLHGLPGFDPSDPEAERLMRHWHEILLEQPDRLAASPASQWHEERLKNFWQNRLVHSARPPDAPGITGDDWQRAAAAALNLRLSSAQRQAMQQRQWQDLVIRSRLHHETKAREMEW